MKDSQKPDHVSLCAICVASWHKGSLLPSHYPARAPAVVTKGSQRDFPPKNSQYSTCRPTTLHEIKTSIASVQLCP